MLALPPVARLLDLIASNPSSLIYKEFALAIADFTFPLAVLGYIGLTISAVVTSLGRPLPAIWRLFVVVVVIHVVLVWA